MIKNEDAQFMLLAGFIVAIGLVITTVMLNNIIFESNMAGEAGADELKYDLVNLMRISSDEMKSAYRNATVISGATREEMISNFTSQMNNFSSNLSIIYAMHGEGVDVSWDISNWNENSDSQFTENGTVGGEEDWTVIENVSSSTIKMKVVTNGMFQIRLKNSSSSELIDLSSPYDELDITNSSTDPYSISFINGANAYGNYSITGVASGNTFIRSRDYILYATITLSNSRIRANITIPVSVPW